MEKPNRLKVSGLWERKTKNGLTFWTGDFTYGTQIEIWPNSKKKSDKEPDLLVYVADKFKKPNPEVIQNVKESLENQGWEDIAF